MSRSLRIVMLAAQHHPLDGRIFHREACALRDAGHDVIIIAPDPGNMPGTTERDGIVIKTYEKRHSGARRKVYTLRQLIRMAKRERAHVYHAHEGDAALIAGAVAKKHWIGRDHRAKLVFDIHEVWPWFYAASTNNLALRRVAVHGFLEYERHMLTRYVDGIITAHELELHAARWQQPFLPHRWVLTAPTFDSPPPERSGPIGVIGHEGYFSLNRGMDIILDAFALLADRYPQLRLKTAGDFQTDRDRAYFDDWAGRTGLSNRVDLSGWVERPQIPAMLDEMDIGIVALREDEHSMRIWPANKLMNYASRALPAVVCTRAPYARREIDERGHGRVVSQDAREVSEALAGMIDHPDTARAMGQRAWEHARRHWNWDDHKRELLRLYDDLRRPLLRDVRTVKLQG